MNQDLAPQDVVAWMRQQAKRFTEMADSIERTFQLNGHQQPFDDQIASRILRVLDDNKARRVNQIAAEIDIAEKDIRRVINDRRATFDVNERGWVTIADRPASYPPE